MIDILIAEGVIKVLLALVLITGAFAVTIKNLMTLITTYSIQSLALALVALTLYAIQPNPMLLYLSALTLAFKVVFIPHVIRRVQKSMNIQRDLEFKYLSPAGSMFVTIILILLVYYAFSEFLHSLSLSNLFYLGAVFGVSLALMGMLVTLTRRKVITKTLGYLTMENGVLLFGIFLTELPFIVEILILIDLIIIVLLATILAVGIDSSIEEFQERINPFHGRREDD